MSRLFLVSSGFLFPAFLFLSAAGVMYAIAYAEVLTSLLEWVICGTLIVHASHELIVGFGRQVQKRYRDDPHHSAVGFDRFGLSLILIAAGFLCGFVPVLLPWVIGFAFTDFPLTHWLLFRHRDHAFYNYRPRRESSPAHKTAVVLFGVGIIGTWILSKGESSSLTVWLWVAGASTSPVAHAFGFVRARFVEFFAEDGHR